MSIHGTGNAAVDLRDAIDQLTLPHDVEVIDHGKVLGKRRQQALLVKLHNARHSNIGTGSGAQTARHERATLNIAASELYASIEQRIRQWARRAGYERPDTWPDTAHLLRLWYARTYTDPYLEPAGYVTTLHNWIDAITDLLINPPHRYQLNAPCPTCGHTWTISVVDGVEERGHTLNVIERDPAHESTITCRHCGATWHGIDGAEQLAASLATGSITIPAPEGQDA